MGKPGCISRRSTPERLLAAVALGIAVASVLAGCGGAGHPRLRAGSLPLISLERLPGNGATPGLQRVLVTRGLMRIQVAPKAAAPNWRIVRRLTLSKEQQRHLARDARAVRGWNKKPGSSCPIRPAGTPQAELLLRVGRHQTLCPPATARALVTFLGTYLPPPTSA